MTEREMTVKERAAIKKLVVRDCANYSREYKECLPLHCPCYMLHKVWTGAFCKYFKSAVLPTDPKLEAALTNEDTSIYKICPVCGDSFLPASSQVYCSDGCRQSARRVSERQRKRNKRQNSG